jgi:hypothetical protein
MWWVCLSVFVFSSWLWPAAASVQRRARDEQLDARHQGRLRLRVEAGRRARAGCFQGLRPRSVESGRVVEGRGVGARRRPAVSHSPHAGRVRAGAGGSSRLDDGLHSRCRARARSEREWAAPAPAEAVGVPMCNRSVDSPRFVCRRLGKVTTERSIRSLIASACLFSRPLAVRIVEVHRSRSSFAKCWTPVVTTVSSTSFTRSLIGTPLCLTSESSFSRSRLPGACDASASAQWSSEILKAN